MEQNLEIKIRKNWRNLKDKLIGKHKEVQIQLYQDEILSDNDMDMVDGIVTPRDKVDLMMKKVMHRKEFVLFMNGLEHIGYTELCKEIKESGSDLITNPKIYTKRPVEVAVTADTLNRLAKLELLADQNTDRFKEYDTQIKKLKEELNTYGTANQHLTEHVNKLEKEYTHLKEEYQSATTHTENLTTHLKETNLEKQQLKLELTSALNMIKGLKEKDSLKKDEVIRRQQDKLDKLKKQGAQYDEQIKILHQKIHKQNEELGKKECDLRNLNQRFEELQRESIEQRKMLQLLVVK